MFHVSLLGISGVELALNEGIGRRPITRKIGKKFHARPGAASIRIFVYFMLRDQAKQHLRGPLFDHKTPRCIHDHIVANPVPRTRQISG